jgi:hypothetical protein
MADLEDLKKRQARIEKQLALLDAIEGKTPDSSDFAKLGKLWLESRSVARGRAGGCFVSTISLDVEYPNGGDEPYLYQTVVCDRTGKVLGEFTQLYPTRELAEIGHRQTMARLDRNDNSGN